MLTPWKLDRRVERSETNLRYLSVTPASFAKMKTSHLIKLTVKLDYRFKNIEYEELGHYLTFHIDRNNLFSITFKNKFLASPFIIDFSESEIRQIKDGARVSFEVENFKEDLNVEHVELDLSIYIDDVNIEKAIKGRQELENFKKSITSAVGIYRLTINGSSYIGQSINLSRRLTNHIDQLISGTHSNTKLQFAWDKYPLDIIFEILEYENLNQQGIQLQDWLAFKERSYTVHTPFVCFLALSIFKNV